MAKIKHDKLLKIKIKHIQYIYNTVKKLYSHIFTP